MNKRPKILIVEWVDSAGLNGWCGSHELEPPLAVCETAGYFVSETRDALTMALNRGVNEGLKPFGELISIPKCAITKRKVVRV